MRVTRQKTHKKLMAVYIHSFAFRPPYQLLLDGNLIHLALQMRADLHAVLKNTLVGDVRPMTTDCVIHELKSLGEDFSGTVLAAKRFEKRRCNHKSPLSAADCISSIIGDSNKHHYCVASQDKELRIKLRDVPGTPLVYISNSVFILEPVSPATNDYIKKMEKSKTIPSKVEVKEVKKLDPTTATGLDKPKKVVMRKKKAKGPNPLSVRKTIKKKT